MLLAIDDDSVRCHPEQCASAIATSILWDTCTNIIKLLPDVDASEVSSRMSGGEINVGFPL